MGLTKETLDYQELLDILHGKPNTYDSALVVVHKGNTAEVYLKQPQIEVGNQQKIISYERVYDTYQIADYVNSRNGYKAEVIHVGSNEIISVPLNYFLIGIFTIFSLVFLFKDKGQNASIKVSLEFCCMLLCLLVLSFLVFLVSTNNTFI